MMTKAEIIALLKALPVGERISIIQELLETIKPKDSTDICGTPSMTRTLTPERLFTKFASQGKMIHTSPPVKHDGPVMGAGGATPTYPDKQGDENA